MDIQLIIAINFYLEFYQNLKINNHATLMIFLPRSFFFGYFMMFYEAILIGQGYTVRRQRIITSLP